ncbi:type II secretion system F family protein [Streptomyces lunaelactis]|uniref:type II secretion system F family protein n=1 Tax=Streptomyces lunaelactis TaxID=1535768 RepID=UPI0015858EB7|nr:type II secretion system F family protein [Streptomyces lunaelactis]NUK27887.1 type II secretion system F family protein [Streptomyces lunaelactis]
MTGGLWWSVCGALLAAGVVAMAVAVAGTAAPKGPPVLVRWRARWLSGPDQQQRAARQRTLLGAAAVVGGLVWLVTGVFVAALLLGTAVVGVPWLLAPTASTTQRIAKLEALGEWTQRLSDVIRLGFGLQQALTSSRKNAPPLLEREVAELAEKLQAGWHPREALEDFANQLDDVTADKACAALTLCANDPGPGLAQALEDLAVSVREEVAERRKIEADRAKSRTAVRWMTIITVLIVLAGFAVPTYTAPYASAVGQLVLALLSGAFTAVLVWMRSLASHRPVPRFLINDPRSRVKQPEPAEVQP